MCLVERKRNRNSSVACKKMSGESFGALFDTRQTVDGPRIVGGFHHCKPRRETERFIHAKTADQLLCNNVRTAVSGNDDRIQIGFVKPPHIEDRCHSVDEGRQIGANSIVVVRTDHDKAGTGLERRIHVPCDDTAVKTLPFLSKMMTSFVGATAAVPDFAVTQ